PRSVRRCPVQRGRIASAESAGNMIAPRLRPSRASTRAPGACEDDAGVLRTGRGADRNAMGWRGHSRFCPPGYAWQAPRELRSIQAGGRGHFYVAVSSPATMYRATVIQGIGGLGHLAIQFAQKFGYQVAAVGRGPESAGLARKLGANVYIDSAATNAAAELQKLGGARVILATAPSAKAMSSLIDGLAANGRMMVIGVSADPIEVTPVQLILGNRSLQGWASGTPPDSEDTLRFAELTGVRPMIEKYPLVKAGEAYARMMSGKAQFR